MPALNACRQLTLNTGCSTLTLRVAVVGASGLPPSIWVFLPCILPGLWPARGSPYPSRLPWLVPLHPGHLGWRTYHPTPKFGIRSGAFRLGWRFEQPGKSEKWQVKIFPKFHWVSAKILEDGGLNNLVKVRNDKSRFFLNFIWFLQKFLSYGLWRKLIWIIVKPQVHAFCQCHFLLPSSAFCVKKAWTGV